MIVWMLACKPPTPVTEVPPTDPVSTADTATPAAPLLSSPAEASDLDPDPRVLHVELAAAPHTWLAGDALVDGFAFNGQVPGPTLRATVGDELIVDLDNQLGTPTSIHWHGVHVPFAMDGAGWRVQPVPVAGAFRYRFTLTQAGTFWYHPHFDTAHQVDRGLYGVLVVGDPADPPVDDELIAVFDSAGEVEAGEHDPTVDPTPLTWLVNGLVQPVWRPASGTTVRLRAVNVSNAGYLELDGRVIAHDQGLLGEIGTSAVLAPGDRADLELSVGDPGSFGTRAWSHAGPLLRDPIPLFSIEPQGASGPPAPLQWPLQARTPTPDPGRTDVRYTFTGSAMEGWEINGATFPTITPDTVALGSEVILEIRNLSPAHHPFHLHGMAFEVLSIDGVAPPVQRVEDTLDIAVQQVVRLRIEADNPGDWMSHCHILPHAENGMMTVFSVVEE